MDVVYSVNQAAAGRSAGGGLSTCAWITLFALVILAMYLLSVPKACEYTYDDDARRYDTPLQESAALACSACYGQTAAPPTRTRVEVAQVVPRPQEVLQEPERTAPPLTMSLDAMFVDSSSTEAVGPSIDSLYASAPSGPLPGRGSVSAWAL
jgi:hypothetical protein